MFDEVIKYSKLLNSENTLIKGSARRNSVYYNLVSYINHTIAFYIAENYPATSVFITRALEEFVELKSKHKEANEYFELCEQYLIKVSRHMIKEKLFLEYRIEMLPEEYRKLILN